LKAKRLKAAASCWLRTDLFLNHHPAKMTINIGATASRLNNKLESISDSSFLAHFDLPSGLPQGIGFSRFPGAGFSPAGGKRF
jgi:hypothetical protein